jgi:hypothetical protein
VNHGALDLDTRVRLAAFDVPVQQVHHTPHSVLPCTILPTGFTFDGIPLPIIGTQRGFVR